MLISTKRTRRCSCCKAEFTPHRQGQRVCSIDCAKSVAVAVRVRAEERARRDRSRETKRALEKLKTRAQWMREVQIAVNKYVRARDEAAGLPCISCGRFHQGQNHAGHFRSVGSAPHLRFDADRNIHLQCAPCNTYLHGNIVNYRSGLIERIGIDAVEALEADQGSKHYTIDDLKAIKAEYVAKRKALEAK